MWIVVEAGPDEGEAAEVTEELLIGSADSCDLPLHGRDVSARHALVRGGQGTATLTDLGTPSGTFLNGMRLVGSLAVVPGDHIRIGEATTLEVLLDAPGTPSALEAGAVARRASRRRSSGRHPRPKPPRHPRRRPAAGAMFAAIVVVLLLVAGIATALAVGGGSRGGGARPRRHGSPRSPPLPRHRSRSTCRGRPPAGFTKFTVTRDGQTLATVSGSATTYGTPPRSRRSSTSYAITGTATNGKAVTQTSRSPRPRRRRWETPGSPGAST